MSDLIYQKVEMPEKMLQFVVQSVFSVFIVRGSCRVMMLLRIQSVMLHPVAPHLLENHLALGYHLL